MTAPHAGIATKVYEARVTTDAPVFLNEQLTEPTILHDPSCNGSFTTCRCQGDRRSVPRSTTVLVVEKRGSAAKMVWEHPDEGSLGPAWVESAILRRTGRGPKIVETQEKSSDIEVVSSLLASVQEISWPVRRRRPKGGEIVFVRDEMQGSFFPEPWRYLFAARTPAGRSVILVDPLLANDVALEAPFHQHRAILCPEGREGSVLYPVFPLPNGANDPGWR